MKKITLLPFCFLFVFNSFASNYAIADTIPHNINKYSKVEFLSEFGKDETSQKIIRYYFYRSKNAKHSRYIFPALTVVTTIFGVSVITGNGGGLSVLVGAAALLYAVSFVYGFFKALNNRKKYAPIKLYKLLMDYQLGKPLPKKLKRQIKYFTRK